MPPIANHNRLLEQKDSFRVLKPPPEYENYPPNSPEYAPKRKPTSRGSAQ